jgi:hypothetical protein
MPFKPRRAFPVALVFAFAATSPVVGRLGAAQRTPERGADLISINFSVVSGDGTPVTDLKAEEVSIRIGSRTRPIRSLQYISVDNAAAMQSDDAEVPAPFGTNSSNAAGRTFVLAIDNDSFRPGSEAPLREAVNALLKGLRPADQMTVLTMPYGGIKVPFTTDRERVRTAVSQIVGQAPASQTGSELACRSRETLEALASYLETFAVREEPITMMVVTAALAAPRRDAVTARPPGMCELPENLYSRVSIAAGAARAQFYVIRPGDAANSGSALQRETNIGSDNPNAGIEHLVGVTEGKLLALTGSSGTAMSRVLRETSGYYLATVDTQSADRSGRTQQLAVRVSRHGLEVRSIPHITLTPLVRATSKVAEPSMRDMLGTMIIFRDLPLRAAGFTALAAEGEKIRVVTLAEPVEPAVKFESVAAGLFDNDGKLVAQWTATPAELQRTPVMGAMTAAPGGYRMRVAAIDTTGRSGTADYEIVVEIAKSGPLKISSLVLGLSRGGAFTPRLQFTSEPLAIAYVELEGAPAGARVSAQLEVAQTLNGQALVAVPLAIESAAANRYAATGSVPLGALPPGDYVVRAMIALEGQPMTRVVRTIRKASVR